MSRTRSTSRSTGPRCAPEQHAPDRSKPIDRSTTGVEWDGGVGAAARGRGGRGRGFFDGNVLRGGVAETEDGSTSGPPS